MILQSIFMELPSLQGTLSSWRSPDDMAPYSLGVSALFHTPPYILHSSHHLNTVTDQSPEDGKHRARSDHHREGGGVDEEGVWRGGGMDASAGGQRQRPRPREDGAPREVMMWSAPITSGGGPSLLEFL